jgi:peptidoglycan/LPS O-acetylase OafA/YrhL
MVVASHVSLFRSFLDPSIPTFGDAFEQAHYAVLIFFALSGYVIGITNRPPPGADGAAWARRYLARRLVRLYPIYLVGIALSVVAAQHTTKAQVLQHLGFLQVILGPTFDSNGPLWSLSYEVFYYLAFVPLFLFRRDPRTVLVGCALIAMSRYLWSGDDVSLIASYSAGMVFWLLGLCIAWYLPTNPTPIPAHRAVAYFLLAIAVPVLNILVHYTRTMWFDAQGLGLMVTYVDFIDLFSIAYLMLVFTNVRAGVWLHVLGVAVVVMAFWGWLYGGHHQEFAFGADEHRFAFKVLLLAPFFYVVPERWISPLIVRALMWVGSISYALYVLHFPLLILVGRYFPVAGHYYLRAATLIAVSFALAYLLERIVQPRLKRRLFPAET